MASSVWRGHLTFGLVAIPVQLYPAARAKKIKLNHVFRQARPSSPEPREPEAETETETEERPPIQRSVERLPFLSGPEVRVDYQPATTDVNEKPREIVKAFEVEKDQYVALEKPELENLAVKTSTAMEISAFVKLDEIDPVFFETSYFVAASPGGEKPYALLFQAMRTSGHVGIASLAMHRREHVVILRPAEKGLLLHTMFYADEVRKEQEFAADTALVNPKELQMAQLLVDLLSESFDASKYRDVYRERLNALIEGKRDQSATSPAAKPVIDIMAALRDSLAKLKKPAAAVTSPRRARRAG